MAGHSDAFPTHIPFRTAKKPTAVAWGVLGLLMVIGVVAFFMGDHERRWLALQFNWLFWSSVAVGMAMMSVAFHVTNARWAWSIRRFSLGGVAFLPASFLLLIVVLFGGSHTYFHHWLEVPADDVILQAKLGWLNLPFLKARLILGVALLFGILLWFAYLALRPDVYGVKKGNEGLYARMTSGWRGAPAEVKRSHGRMMVLAPIAGLLFAVLWGMVAIDLVMSMDPHFYSTMFPVAFFVSAFHSGIAMTAILVTVFRKQLGLEAYITGRQYHDLGKMVFAFAVFWMYINWSQYVVIWYGLLPWEQAFYVKRFEAPFTPLAQAVPLLIFVIPFLALFTRAPKKVPGVLSGVAAIILLGHWLERFMISVPSVWTHENLPMGFPEIGMGLGFAGLFFACYFWYASRFPLLPSPMFLAAADPATVELSATATRPARA